jgi:diaminopimelate decarboxylase
VYFLSHGYPAEVVVRRGRTYLVRRRDTVDDVLAKQSTHPDLATYPDLGTHEGV